MKLCLGLYLKVNGNDYTSVLATKFRGALNAAEIPVERMDVYRRKEDLIKNCTLEGLYDCCIVMEALEDESFGPGSVRRLMEMEHGPRVVPIIGAAKKSGMKLRTLWEMGCTSVIYDSDITADVLADILVKGRTPEEALVYYGLEDWHGAAVSGQEAQMIERAQQPEEQVSDTDGSTASAEPVAGGFSAEELEQVFESIDRLADADTSAETTAEAEPAVPESAESSLSAGTADRPAEDSLQTGSGFGDFTFGDDAVDFADVQRNFQAYQAAVNGSAADADTVSAEDAQEEPDSISFHPVDDQELDAVLASQEEKTVSFAKEAALRASAKAIASAPEPSLFDSTPGQYSHEIPPAVRRDLSDPVRGYVRDVYSSSLMALESTGTFPYRDLDRLKVIIMIDTGRESRVSQGRHISGTLSMRGYGHTFLTSTTIVVEVQDVDLESIRSLIYGRPCTMVVSFIE